MGAPSDPSQGGAGLADLWPSLSGLFGPPSPQQWAWALAQHGQQQGAVAPAAQSDGTPDWPGATPANQVWADAVQNAGRALPASASDGTGMVSTADASTSPPMSAMAAPDAPDQDDAPAQDAPPADAGPPSQPGPDGAPIPASAVAAPSAAQVPVSPAPSDGQTPPPPSARNPAGQFLRPELSAGPDPLVAALAGDHPNDNPFGFIVDRTTGSVSRPSFGAGQATLAPVSPQDKQSYLEWLTGARANHPLGQVSPEEKFLRQKQTVQSTIGGKPRGQGGPAPHTSPGGVRYATAESLTPSQQGILDKVVDTGQRMGMSPDLIKTVANQAFYESSLGLRRKNPTSPSVKGLFQYLQTTWDEHARPEKLDINSDSDQIGLMYRDAARYKAQYDQSIANRNLSSPLNFEQYVELNHHMGDHALQLGKHLPSDFNGKIGGFGFRILSLPPS